MSGSVVLVCTCQNPFQDKTYGKQKRLCNLSKTEAKADCTVCGKELISGKAALADKKKKDKEVEKANDTKTKKV